MKTLPNYRQTFLLLASLSLGLAPLGCSGGSDDHDHDMHGMGGMHGGHDHSDPIDVSGDETPTLELVAHEDGTSFNLQLTVENFTFAPESASTDHVEGEGHAHLYVDGEKITRLYGPWYHLSGLAEGEHEVRVELSANSHNPLSVDGELVDATVTLDVPAPGAHGTHEMQEVDWEPVPSVELIVNDDPKSGWNIEAVTSDFVLTPENVSGDPVDGEGHMHLYVNDTKIARMYGNWFYVGELPLGDVSLRVELSSNDHRTLMFDGAPIDDVKTVTVTESDPHSHEDNDHAMGGATH